MSLNFIDLFSGCGGLSLGLLQSGWCGNLAIEKTKDAFSTYKTNLINKSLFKYNWIDGIPLKNMTTRDLLDNYSDILTSLKGHIDLIAGGPPCQGFSYAGLRDPKDPRNLLFEEYVEIVEKIEPKLILLENVKGMTSVFNKSMKKSYSDILIDKITNMGYTVFSEIKNASQFGVPQNRMRFIMIAVRNEFLVNNPFNNLEEIRSSFLNRNNIHDNTNIEEAISDMCFPNSRIEDYNNRFKRIIPDDRAHSTYQKLMKKGNPNSLRLPNHKNEIIERFKYIQNKFEKGKPVNREQLVKLGTKKRTIVPLHPKKASRTITTLPDDYIHYCEPRILTVRENARLQSFPDWFEFCGKYTTGGKMRKVECPRYSQVGNAVPPLMSSILGELLYKYLNNERNS